MLAISKQLLVDRSLVHNAFGVGRSQGVMVGYKNDQFKFDAAWSNGMGPNPGNEVPWNTYDTEFAATARAEFLLAGEWGQFSDFTSWQGEEFGCLVGAGIHWESDEYGENVFGTDEAETFRWTIDGSFEFGGANLYAALFGNHVSADAAEDLDQYGFVIHGGFFLNEDWELFARVEWADEDATDVDELTVGTIGVNRYFAKHQVKWTTDLGFGFEEVTGTFASNGLAWRQDSVDEDGQLVLRTQLQLTF